MANYDFTLTYAQNWLDFDIKAVRLNLDKGSYLPIWKWNKKLSLEPLSVLSLHLKCMFPSRLFGT